MSNLAIPESNFGLSTSKKTPIEVALKIDADGNTTARALYEFLELDLKNYSHWCKRNILENQYAEANVDFWAFVVQNERDLSYNPNPTTDYKLTASFAKKLCMTSKSSKGEQARNYFIKVEDGLKKAINIINGSISDLSPTLQMLTLLTQQAAANELKMKELENKVDTNNNTLSEIKNILTTTDPSWRQTAKRKINQVVNFTRKSYPEIVNESYEMLRNSAGCNLTTRLEHMKERMYKQGLPHTQVKATNIMDVIQSDAKLKSWYTEIVNKLVIKYIVGNEVTV